MVSKIAEAALPLYSYPEEFLPESDGKPMAETDLQRDQMVYLLDALKEYFRDDPQVYVTGNIFLYYRDEAQVRQSASPDIFVVRGVAKHQRRIYNLDKEGQAPQVVIELTSANTKVEDLVSKRHVYKSLGVSEYFLFDPYGEILHPNLRGFRLEGGDYVPMLGTRLYSEGLGLDLIVVEDRFLRLHDHKTGERLPTREEVQAARRKAEAEAKTAKKKAAQQSAARRKAEAEAKVAEKNAAQELTARQAAEEELTRLREEVNKLRSAKN